MSMWHTSWARKPAATSAATSAPAEVPATRWKTAPRSSITDKAPDSAIALDSPTFENRVDRADLFRCLHCFASPRMSCDVPGTYVKDRAIVVGTWSGVDGRPTSPLARAMPSLLERFT